MSRFGAFVFTPFPSTIEYFRAGDGPPSALSPRARSEGGTGSFEREDDMADNKKIAADVLEALGGKDNITFAAHCMTRLRFNLKDMELPDINAVKKINGVIGAQISGGQFQVIIGQNVPKVYDELIKMSGLAKQESIDENLDTSGVKTPLTPAAVGNAILNYPSGSMVPMIPLLLASGMFKTVAVVLGPTMLNLIADTSDLYVLLNMLYNVTFYFIPIFLGFTAAKNIGATPMYGAFMGGVLIEPTFMQMAAEGKAFSVYGIPCVPANYAQTVIPILLTVALMSVFEKFLRKHMPDSLTTVFTPLCTLALTVPFALCLLAPLGSWCGNGLAVVFEFLGAEGGIVAIIGGGLLAAIWLPMVITGMHVAVIMIAIANFMLTGSDSFILVAPTVALWAAYGAEIATWLKLRNKEEKSQCAGYVVAQLIGGVGEPFIYGMMFRYRKLFVACMAGSFVAGAVALALHVNAYLAGAASNVLNIMTFVGGGNENLISAVIASAAGFVVSFAVAWFFGFSEDELENGPISER